MTELEPCPVCGSMMVKIGSGGFAGEAVETFCRCGYIISLDPGEDAPDGSGRETADYIAHAHNTLARRAEIGKLVEQIVVPGNRRLVLIGDYVKIEQGNMGPPDSFAEGASSLLDALRALATKLTTEPKED